MRQRLKKRLDVISTKYVWIYSVVATFLVLTITFHPYAYVDLYIGRATEEDIAYAREYYYDLRDATAHEISVKAIQKMDRQMERGFKLRSKTWLRTEFQHLTHLLYELMAQNEFATFFEAFSESAIENFKVEGEIRDEIIEAYTVMRDGRSRLPHTYFTRDSVLLEYLYDFNFAGNHISQWLFDEYNVHVSETKILSDIMIWGGCFVGTLFFILLPHPLTVRMFGTCHVEYGERDNQFHIIGKNKNPCNKAGFY